jgi:uncharacterized membrane protein YdjX (TVP38/TMEM64 family)
MKMNKTMIAITLKFLLIIFLVALIALAYNSGILKNLNFSYLKTHLDQAKMFFANYPVRAIIIYFTAYVFATAVSIPGVTILSILGGAVFGTFFGTIMVSFASTIGATFSFLITRFLLRDYVAKKFHIITQEINKNIDREGVFYLLSLRLIPLFPFFIINMVMGLTSISAPVFFIVSQIGMFPATIIYVYAGKKISEINSVSEILNPGMIMLFILLSTLPYFANFLMTKYRKKKAGEESNAV